MPQKQLADERERVNQEAAEKAKEMDLPSLQGSEKQVAWANTIRQNFIDAFKRENGRFRKKALANGRVIKVATLKLQLDNVLQSKETAKWYIDNRDGDIFTLIEDNCVSEEEVAAKEYEAEAKTEAAVQPAERKHNGVVEIEANDGVIKAKYEKNEDFIEVVKILGYRWKNVWQREITAMSGPIEDRAAELGNKLLNAGFAIMILDPDVRRKAIEADYEPECDRWIMRRVGGDYDGWLVIRWNGENNEIYQGGQKTTREQMEQSSGSS